MNVFYSAVSWIPFVRSHFLGSMLIMLDVVFTGYFNCRLVRYLEVPNFRFL